MLNEKINVINVGTDVFAEAIKAQGVPAEHLNWKPGKKIISKALDNRVGCYALIEAMKRVIPEEKGKDQW